MTVLPFRRPRQRSLGGGSRPPRRLLGDVLLAAGILFVVWAVAYGLNAPRLAPTVGMATVHDGDTLTIGGERMRLKGIDAPELAQTCDNGRGATFACGREARERLRGLTQGRRVECVGWGRDRYRRRLVRCEAGGRDLNAALVGEGWAVAYGDYMVEELAARAGGRGLWAGDFDLPQDWRADHGDAAGGSHDLFEFARGLVARMLGFLIGDKA